jgi:hypothetical protein
MQEDMQERQGYRWSSADVKKLHQQTQVRVIVVCALFHVGSPVVSF